MAIRRLGVRRTREVGVPVVGDPVRARRNRRPDAVRLPASDRLARFANRVRGRHLAAIDILGIAVAGYAAIVADRDRLVGIDIVGAFVPIIGLLLVVRMVTNVGLGLYTRGWRFASTPELIRIVVAVGIGTLATVTTLTLGRLVAGPNWLNAAGPSFWLNEMLLSMIVLGGSRFGIRVASDWATASSRPDPDDSRITLLYGAGRTGVLMARSAYRKPAAGVAPVGFLDDDPSLAGSVVAGLKVFGGLAELPRAVARTGAKSLLITMPGAPGNKIRAVVEGALELGLEVRIVPSVTDLLDGTVDAYRIRRVRLEDLLRRPTSTAHSAWVDEVIRDRVVLITGAGGSIGSELARQVYALAPRAIVLIDRAESALYLIARELEMRRKHGKGGGEIRVHLANVASAGLMRRLIGAERPSIIFHAAAYKHVPMLEDHPSDAVHVNIRGTEAVLDAAIEARVERFVLVSTDKAVRPTSVMGASKRIAEMLVADTALRTGLPYVSVRFGNVLGSTGSVVPIFQEQLEKGEPLTITHPEMTRYFMTIPEASWLILEAGAIGRTGDLFVLDMGAPVSILELARDLIRLAGRDPDSQPIEVVGLRPGEKLHEELFYPGEEVVPTATDKLLRGVSPPPTSSVRDEVRALFLLATGDQEARLRDALLELAGAFDGAPPTRDVPDEDAAPESPAVTAVDAESERVSAGA
jgi:FlaA1/EpsC-like NDP-sugar epimerase